MGMIKGFMWDIFDMWSFVQNMIWPITVTIAVVIICRLFVKKISKQASYFLWLIVAIRLICPITISSEFSIFNLIDKPQFMTTVENSNQILMEDYSQKDNNNLQQIVSNNVPEYIEQMEISEYENDKTKSEEWSDTTNTKPTQSVQAIEKEELTSSDLASQHIFSTNTNSNSDKNHMHMSDEAKCVFWLTGVILMILYGVISYTSLKRKLRFATKNENGYFESEHITSPFVLGILKPVIYLPCYLTEEEKNYILLHERYHIKRFDYLVKVIAFGLLCMYWLHPFVWLAFYLMSQDMEMSCDEQVLKELGSIERKAYSTLLLSFAAGKRFPLPTPLSFGESNTKSRIKQILNYKKPTKQALILAVGLMILVAVICLTDASNEERTKDNNQDAIENHTDNKTNPETGQLTDEYLKQLSEKLYEAKNPYIGNISANGKIINYLKEALDITDTNGMELQTSQEPYWITLGFDKKPDDKKMFQLATMFLILVDNASEFRWEFPTEDSDEICEYYVNEKIVNVWLSDYLPEECKIKDYAENPETISSLWRLLEKVSMLYKSENKLDYLVRESEWEHFAQLYGFDFTESNKWENRLLKDDLLYTETENEFFSVREITSCIYDDFDENGQMDLAVLITGYFGEEYGSRLFFYMDDAKQYSYGSDLMNRCFDMDIQTADLDRDGFLEFVLIGGSNGSGGAGSYCKDILKYKNSTFSKMVIPGDYAEYNKEFPEVREMGYELEVYWGEEMDTYDIYCPTLNVTKTVYSPYLRDEKGDLYSTPQPGVLAGGNCRGFHTLKITEIDGVDCLVGTEVITGDGGTAHCFADARFVMEWDDDNGWIVKDFYVMSFDYGVDTEDIFETMKQSLKYQTSNLEEIADNYIPIINYKKNEIIDYYDRFSNFARTSYSNYETGLTFVGLNVNKEPIYVRILRKDGIYYYLEDYTRLTIRPEDISDYGFATYTNEIYTVQKNENGEYIEYFYLTNEEGLTLEELQENVSSSSTRTHYNVKSVYHKVLDEEGLSKYMATTGDILDLDIQIQLPEDSNWIRESEYKVFKETDYEKPIAKVDYYDGIIFADMTLLVGAKEDVLKNTDITAYLDHFTPESLCADTADGEIIPIDFYVIPIDDIYKMAAVIWEYKENTYVLYGKTAAGDCNSVTRAAAYIIGYLE